jgi:hypothetical protein
MYPDPVVLAVLLAVADAVLAHAKKSRKKRRIAA